MEAFIATYIVFAAIGLVFFGSVMIAALAHGDRCDAIVGARLALGSLVWPVAIPAYLVYLAFQKI
jgi:uncharacterized membrane protein